MYMIIVVACAATFCVSQPVEQLPLSHSLEACLTMKEVAKTIIDASLEIDYQLVCYKLPEDQK
jgi:hypothetical protein